MVADKKATYLNLKFLNGKVKTSMVLEIHVRVLFREGRQHYTQVLGTPQRQARASWDRGKPLLPTQAHDQQVFGSATSPA